MPIHARPDRLAGQQLERQTRSRRYIGQQRPRRTAGLTGHAVGHLAHRNSQRRALPVGLPGQCHHKQGIRGEIQDRFGSLAGCRCRRRRIRPGRRELHRDVKRPRRGRASGRNPGVLDLRQQFRYCLAHGPGPADRLQGNADCVRLDRPVNPHRSAAVR